jgi:hypothetical protein
MFIYHRTEDFKSSLRNTKLLPIKFPNIKLLELGGLLCLFLKSSFLDADFTEIFFPIASNLSTLDKAHKLFDKPCVKSALLIYVCNMYQ